MSNRGMIIGTLLSSVALAGCVYYPGPYYHRYYGRDYDYDGYYPSAYYDGYYGPYYGGYWGGDNCFYYQGRDHQYFRDEGQHFRRDAFYGARYVQAGAPPWGREFRDGY